MPEVCPLSSNARFTCWKSPDLENDTSQTLTSGAKPAAKSTSSVELYLGGLIRFVLFTLLRQIKQTASEKNRFTHSSAFVFLQPRLTVIQLAEGETNKPIEEWRNLPDATINRPQGDIVAHMVDIK